jgi:hypothetical protein
MTWKLAITIAAVLASGCGGRGYSGVYMVPAAETSSDTGGMTSAGGYGGEGGQPDRPQYAQNQPQRGDEETASDATAVPLLIYTAQLGLSVHQVTEKMDRVEAIARELGGFLASRSDNEIRIRVPSQQFQTAMEQIQALGNVVSRRIDVEDVTEEFHDVEVRISTLEAMRRRFEDLLRQANNVEAALAVQRELERVTVELERLRGRLRYLGNQVAFSTITVRFQERADTTEPDFQLPFQWLQNLGLQRLLQL